MDILARAIPGIGDFPYSTGERTFDRKTLFIKGTKSKYINRKNEPLLREFFPQSQLETVDAGHWGAHHPCTESADSDSPF